MASRQWEDRAMTAEEKGDGALERVGLIGHPVAHSRSPAMQQAALDALGIPARYALWDTPAEGLADRVAALRAPGMLGANVTLPHKLAVIPLLDDLAAEARRVAGAVNTIVRVEDAAGRARLVGHNTDVAGLAATLRAADAWPAGRRVVVLGAGGAAQAVAGLVADAGAAGLVVAARRVAAAARLLAEVVARLGARPAEVAALDLADAGALAVALGRCDLLVNTTPVGMGAGDGVRQDAMPIDPAALARLPAEALVLDIVYTPTETALLRAARAAGRRTANGLPMLLRQGAAAFELWTGRPAPLAVMRAALGLDERSA
jgi:shikimate dehydrogenase